MIDQLNYYSQVWWDWMAPMFWQVSLLILIISVVDTLISKWAWPQVRYALWVLVLLKLVIPPTFSLPGSIIPNVREIIQKNTTAETINPNTIILDDAKKSLNRSDVEKPIAAQEENYKIMQSTSEEQYSSFQQDGINWKFYLMLLWILGMISFFLMLLLRISKLKKWHTEQVEKKDIPVWFHELLIKIANHLSVERMPAIVFSNKVVTPAVYGVFRPVFLLPEKYIDSLSREEAEHILLHELAHVKRGDLIVHGICLLLQIIYWFNPLLIWVRKQMKHIREICCDLTIANVLREKTAMYRQTLLNTARKLFTESVEPGMGLLGLFEEPFRLISRLNWLEKKSWEKRRTAYLTTFIVSLLFIICVLPMGENKIQASDLPNSIKNVEGKDINELRSIIKSSNSKLNAAFIERDFETISKYYTDDVILDQHQRPSVHGKAAFLTQLKEDENSGMNFISLQNDIIELWRDNENIYVIESYSYIVSSDEIPVSLSGTGKSLTIWRIQENGSLKIKYSILNVDSAIPYIITNEE